MKFKERYLFLENQDADTEWYDYLDEEGYIPKKDVLQFVESNSLELIHPVRDNAKLIELRHGENFRCLVLDSDDTFVPHANWSEWIDDSSSDDLMDILEFDVDSVWNPYIDETLGYLKKNPPTVYHYTTEESWETIQEKGFLKMAYGTGLTNRHLRGVFTSIDSETYADGTYGDICLQIDLKAMHQGKDSELDLSYEPDVDDYLIREHVYGLLNIEDRGHSHLPSDMSPTTIVVGQTIPIEFVRMLD